MAKAAKKQWLKMALMDILCILFVFWSGYYWVLLLLPVFFDSHITRYIPWGAWKKSKNVVVDWLDAIVFALVVVYFVNTFFIQNYQIPSSSLEKSLLVGDFLCVSKVSFGARSPMTPFSFPLVQHTFPVLNIKSYLEKPQLEYKRLAGFGQVERNDIVVFNFPAGDTVALNIQEKDYYSLCAANPFGRVGVWADKNTYGDIVYRPVDRRENYVKRCIGLPGETISLQNDTVFIDGKPVADPENVQRMYIVQTDGTQISPAVFDELGMSNDDMAYIQPSPFAADSLIFEQLGLKWNESKPCLLYKRVFLTNKMVKDLESKPFVLAVKKHNSFFNTWAHLNNQKCLLDELYPLGYYKDVELGDFPPLWIPKRGVTITFDADVDYKVAAYHRCIHNYEHNDFDYRDGKVYINGQAAASYTFKYDYFFMMGDNRDNSADSRVWGFVPEDHVVGKPLFIWLSLNKDKGWFNGKIRWNRLFTSAKK
ncbi:MAG: S26 family signal peptidase [Prevotella sp.]|nr:S26 family signal peptidase [Prevotella sp.]